MSKTLKVKIKKLDPRAVIPTYSNLGDACLDITAISETIVEESGFGFIEYGTGLAFQFPDNYVMEIYPRSSISNTGLILANSPSQIDSSYRGEVKLRFKWVKGSVKYNVGDRIAQLKIVPYPTVVFEEVEELDATVRSSGAFGSSGK